MKVLIAGSGGLLGSTLLNSLKKRGVDVVGLTKSGSNGSAIDVLDQQKLNKYLDYVKPNIIINLIAEVDVDLCEKNPSIAYIKNVKILDNLANWVRQNSRINAFIIQISTDQNYDSLTLSAENELIFSNCYGLTKYCAELSIMDIDSIILRTNFFGRSLVENRASFTDWIYGSLAAKKIITVFDNVFFSPISINTISNILFEVIKKPVFGTYNFGSNGGMSKSEFAFSFARALNMDVNLLNSGKISDVFLTAKRPHNMMMDVTNFESKYKMKLPMLHQEIILMKDQYAIKQSS